MICAHPALVFSGRTPTGAGGLFGSGQFRWRAFMPALLALLLAALAAAPARAEIWGYVDLKGNGHFAAHQVDERYELFLRSTESLQEKPVLKEAASETRPAQNSGAAGASPRKLAYFQVSPSYKAVKHLIREASTTHGIDYELLQAVIATESGFNARAVSPKGAIGLMQLIVPTAARYGVKDDKDSLAEEKLTDPKTNIRAGSSYLNYLIKLFPGELELAIAAYNAGEGAVKRAGNKIPNYPETQNYVKTVMKLYQHLKPPASLGVRTTAIATANAATAGRRVRVQMTSAAQGRGMMPVAVAYEP